MCISNVHCLGFSLISVTEYFIYVCINLCSCTSLQVLCFKKGTSDIPRIVLCFNCCNIKSRDFDIRSFSQDSPLLIAVSSSSAAFG